MEEKKKLPIAKILKIIAAIMFAYGFTTIDRTDLSFGNNMVSYVLMFIGITDYFVASKFKFK